MTPPEAYFLVFIGALIAALAIVVVMWASERHDRERAEAELAASHQVNDDLRAAVKDLLATRRTATRERFLGLIEEQRAKA